MIEELAVILNQQINTQAEMIKLLNERCNDLTKGLELIQGFIEKLTKQTILNSKAIIELGEK